MPAPPSEVDITPELVTALVRAQHPAHDGEVRLVAHGWDNDIYRLGDRFSARLPRRATAVPLVANEQHWLPELAPWLPVAVPVALAAGVAGEGYPWPWSILPWFEGRSADELTPAERAVLAEPLADILRALHRPAPPDAPVNSYRGVPLAERDATVRRRIDALEEPTAEAARTIWRDALAARPSATKRWAHGDLHPANVLVGADGAITALIDFGDLSGGDPAVDVAGAWLFFDDAGRARFRARYDADDDTWRRARGWALAFALALMQESDDSDRMVGLGRFGVGELLANGF